MEKPFVVRKLDLADPHWYVVDLRIEGAAILAEEAVAYRGLNRRFAVEAAAALNSGSSGGGE